jgi:hypothetical protein
MAFDTTAEAKAERKIQKIVLPGQTPEGGHILSVLLKRTYSIIPDETCARAEKDAKIVTADQHWGDPMNSSVKHEADFVPFKLATDVVLNGKVYAPAGKETYSLLAALEVGNVRKVLLVTGDRECVYRGGSKPAFTDPLPFAEMELRYERAYGGADIYSDPKLPCLYVRNIHGRGFVVQNKAKTVDGLLLPNLEDPSNPITPETLCCGHFMYWDRQPMPQNFGWFPKSWLPRASLAGVMPADRATEKEMREIYGQFVPPQQKAMYEQTKLPDMDFRFFNGASEGLVVPYLKGDEPIATESLSKEGHLTFQLPGDPPSIAIDIGEGVKEPEVVLHTVMIRMEERQVDLVWRGAIPYAGPDWLPQMKKMEVSAE